MSVRRNSITLTTDPGFVAETTQVQSSGLLLSGAFGGHTSRVQDVHVAENCIDTDLVGIDLLGGIGVPQMAAVENSVSGVEVRDNRVVRPPTLLTPLFPELRGINLAGGIRAATGNRVTGVVVAGNSVAGVPDAVSTLANIGPDASGNLAEAILRPTVSYPSPSATSVTTTTAMLRATVDPRGAETSYRFEYGTSAAYGSTAGTGMVAATGGPRTVTATLQGLTPMTAYHFRVVAENQVGTAAGDDQSVTALALPPTVGYAGVAATPTTATMKAVIDPRGSQTTYHFEYGTSATLGSTAGSGMLAATGGPQTVTATLQGLAPVTAYHFRVVAENQGGTAAGADQTVMTLAVPPRVRYTGAVVTGTTARVKAVVDARGSATTYFVTYGRSKAYGRSTGKRTISPAAGREKVSERITALRPGTSYHYRIVARSRGGVTLGPDATFKTKRPPHRAHRH